MHGWYEELVATARREVGRELDDYPFELAWDQYRRAALGTTVYPVTAMGAMDPSNERGRELVEAMANRAFTACLDLGSADFLSSSWRPLRAWFGHPGVIVLLLRLAVRSVGHVISWWRRRPWRGQSNATRAPVPERVA